MCWDKEYALPERVQIMCVHSNILPAMTYNTCMLGKQYVDLNQAQSIPFLPHMDRISIKYAWPGQQADGPDVRAFVFGLTSCEMAISAVCVDKSPMYCISIDSIVRTRQFDDSRTPKMHHQTKFCFSACGRR